MPPESRSTCPPREQLERFAATNAIDDAQRAHLDTCRDCRQALDTIRADNDLFAEFLAANPAQLDTPTASVIRDTPPPGYEIIEELHRGGQGVVYRAIHHATKREVALKLLLQGTFATDKQRARFEREVETLATLQHPNIVTVYDGGPLPDGRMFLAMQYVPGQTLDQWMDASRPRDQVLALFRAITGAVAAAHQRGIMHRDLKPANIIVTPDDQPLILDFGLAKPADTPDTQTTIAGEFVGTFAYAAPEQVAGDPDAVDTRADIYALGVVLYELLADQRPYDLRGSLRDIISTIERGVATPPSRHRPGIDADLDAITLKALAVDRGKRYQTARELIADLDHYERHEPISARRRDRAYVLRKTIRRYRLPLSIAAAVFVLLATASIITFAQYRLAAAEGQRVKQAIASIITILGRVDQENTDAPLPATSILELLDDAAEIVRTELAAYPRVRAPIEEELGGIYMSHEQFDRAGAHLDTAAELSAATFGPRSAEVASVDHQRGRLAWKRGHYTDAEVHYQRALALRMSELGRAHTDTARTMQHLAVVYCDLDRLDDAEPLCEHSLSIRRTILRPDHPDIAGTLHVMGNIRRGQQRYEEAADYYTQALDLIDSPDNFRTARSRHQIARCYIEAGRFDDAEAALDESLRIKQLYLDSSDPDIANNHHERALLTLRRSSAMNDVALLSDALRYCDDALALRIAALADDHPDVGDSHELRGDILHAQQHPDQAAAAYQQALHIFTARLGADHRRTTALRDKLN